MPATTDDYTDVRYDLDTDATNMPDAEIDRLFARSEAVYGAGTNATQAWVRVLGVRRLKAGAAKRVDYKQNQSQEWLSQLMTNLTALEKQFMGDLDVALGNSLGVVRFGALRRFQPRVAEYPETFFDDAMTDDDEPDISRID